jgi:glutaredoxin
MQPLQGRQEVSQHHGINYDYTDIDLLTGEQRDDALEEVRLYNPNLSFPTILIGDKTIGALKRTR